REDKADLLILDVGLPDMNGFEVCKQLRRFSDVPVIFLTARGDEVDRVVGLEIGADDYVVKPFSPREVVARVKTILRRRMPPMIREALQVGAFVVDEARASIAFRGVVLELTRYEYRLLKTLITEPGRVFDRDALMGAAWEHPDVSLERTVDTHIKQLRAKLKAIDPSVAPIRTHRGLGYSLAPDTAG
ncbi:MAG: two-component system response regulator CreB, partial [Proteobacteria bacterium]|nr:two-component system response regulator CreB [Pseudomonadota bacterium]